MNCEKSNNRIRRIPAFIRKVNMISQFFIRGVLIISSFEWLIVIIKLIQRSQPYSDPEISRRFLPELIITIVVVIFDMLFGSGLISQMVGFWANIAWVIFAIGLPILVFWRLSRL